MAKSSAPGPTIRPPRVPKGEDPAVTIANQARHIDNLVERAAALVKERDELLKRCRVMGDEILSHRAAGESLCSEVDKLKSGIAAASATNTRMLGWQDCAREVFTELLSRS